MTGLQELKDTYEMIKNEYGYICKSISLPYEDNEYTKFVFEYQGFPIKHSFSYLLYESPYGENDDVEFFDNENEVIFTVSQLFAITDFVKIIQNNRDNKDVINEFIKYLKSETRMWNPETDACNYCKECDYFLHEYWNCQGDEEPCFEFQPKKDSKFNKVEITVTNNSDKNIRGKRAKFAVEDDWYIDQSIINEVLDGFVKKQ